MVRINLKFNHFDSSSFIKLNLIFIEDYNNPNPPFAKWFEDYFKGVTCLIELVKEDEEIIKSGISDSPEYKKLKDYLKIYEDSVEKMDTLIEEAQTTNLESEQLLHQNQGDWDKAKGKFFLQFAS